MGYILLAIFIAVPLIEIGLFIAVGEQIGLFPTLAVVILTAFAGTALLRAQSMAALARARQHMGQGEMPIEDVLAGVFLLAAGLLLLTPGFFTDAIGFLLFIPAFRRTIGRKVFEWVLKNGSVHVHRSGAGFGGRPGFGAGPGDIGSRGPGPHGGPHGDPRPGHQAGPRPGVRSGPGQTIEGEYEDLNDRP